MKLSRSIKFITALILICASLVPCFAVFTSASRATSFVDVNKKSWYYDAVNYCQIQGYINGVTNNRFDPHGNITREQFVMILANMSNADYNKYKYIPSGMKDVPTDMWYSGAITWAVQKGYVSGISKDRFGLGKAIDRASLVTLLYRYAKANGDVVTATADLSKYSDYSKVQPWMEEGLRWAVTNSIITSTSSTEMILDPAGTATRAQTAVMLKAYDKANSLTVGTNRQALIDRIMIDYTEPKQEHVKRIPYEAYVTTVKNPVPEQCKYIYDWFIGVILNKDLEYKDNEECELYFKKVEDYNVFSDFLSSSIDWACCYYIRNDANGKPLSIILSREGLLDMIYGSYNGYVKHIEEINNQKAEQYQNQLSDYYGNLATATMICDMVEEAVIASGAVGKPVKEAVNCVIDYICRNCEYHYDALNDYTLDAFSVNACLTNKRAVCDGYAKTFYAMCYYLGLDVEYCRGVTDTGTPHAWNKITVNGKVYYFDVTWHDSINANGFHSSMYVWADNSSFAKEHKYEDSTIYSW